MGSTSHNSVSFGQNMERRCLMDCKVHKRQAFCCAVNDYLLQLKASGGEPPRLHRMAKVSASWGGDWEPAFRWRSFLQSSSTQPLPAWRLSKVSRKSADPKRR